MDYAPFLLDLSKATLAQLRELAQDQDLVYSKAGCCDYHEHKKDLTCPNRKRKREVDDDGGGGSDGKSNEDTVSAEEFRERQAQLKQMQETLATIKQNSAEGSGKS